MAKYESHPTPKFGRWVWVSVLAAFLVLGIVAAANLVPAWLAYRTAQQEYNSLRQHAPRGEDPEAEDPLAEEKARIAELVAINPDFAGWIRIDGTTIDYPVVRGADNDFYLYRTFTGEPNGSGSIFMDFRNRAGFDGAHAILYGHAMRDGSMFAALRQYLSSDFLSAHPTISITGLDAVTVSYRVVAVRSSTIYDTVYTLPNGARAELAAYLEEIGAPTNSTLLALSTCINVDTTHNDRLLVLAVRV